MKDWSKHFRDISARDRANAKAVAVPQLSDGASFGIEPAGLGPSSYSPMFGSVYGPSCPQNPHFGVGELGYGGWARFGSDVSDAVIAYRKLWNDYVMSTARGMDLASASLQNVAMNPPSGFSADELIALANSYANERDDLTQAWNQFSGKSVDDMTAEGAVMLKSFQDTVADAQKFWADDRAKENKLHAAGSEPPIPSPAAQAAVKAQIDASGAASRSSLSLAIQSTTGITPPTVPSLPSAGDVGAALARFAKDHWVGIGVTLVGVGLGLKAASLVGRGYLKVATGGLL